ncbi:MAG TPA: hypothetical protein PLB55_01330 [Prosthecobacter sp.]|jgi:hypothetical protein|nr:hypothetical protein [Prosthecobacter sp.]
MKTQTFSTLLGLLFLASCAGGGSRSSGLPSSTKVTRDGSGRITVTGRDTASVLLGAEMAARGQVAPTPVATSTPPGRKTRDDLEAEKEMRRKIQNNQFIPGYQGGPLKYSTGSGVKTFVP